MATVRPAEIHDVVAIHHLIENYAAMGNLLPRPMNELYRHLRDFFVVEVDGRVVGCGALEIFTEILGEVRSLVVEESHKGLGLGRLLVERIMEEAANIGLSKLMALTYVPEFFHKLGFQTVDKDTLPEKVWGICVKCYKYGNCDEIAVLKNVKPR
ncbi:MAG: N-acetyltransferase [Gammaproteobacteria bacterium]|nr:N-acetyltransferase [Gammaproteobacteria bacterium]